MAIRRRPSRPSLSRARSFVSTLSLVLVVVIAILALCPVTVKAEEDKKSEYGSVIGIGKFVLPLISCILFSPAIFRFGNDVRDSLH
jgi:uncharacterized BrkB/YihY/UPF0761 family membrane protein